MEQARHDVGLPNRFRASITVGARIALWEGFLPEWVGRMRESEPDISISSEIGFEEGLMRRMAEPLIAAGKLFNMADSPLFRLPVYVVFQREADTLVVGQALASLRELAEAELGKAEIWLKS